LCTLCAAAAPLQLNLEGAGEVQLPRALLLKVNQRSR
jgi:hypothetical protein